jgi:hypothetical protein
MSRRPAVLLAITVFLAACGAGGDGPDPDLDTPLLQIRYEGGFAPADFALTQGPTYTLTRDGILISPAAVPAIFPGPLVTPYMSSQVTPGELDQLQDMIEAIGLPEMVDEYDNDAIDFVADAHTTVVTYWDSEGAHAYSVYALGIAEPTKGGDTGTAADGHRAGDHRRQECCRVDGRAGPAGGHTRRHRSRVR